MTKKVSFTGVLCILGFSYSVIQLCKRDVTFIVGHSVNEQIILIYAILWSWLCLAERDL